MAGRLGGVVDGALAGAAGTLALDATTYLDMLLTGRDASRLPEQAARPMVERIFGGDARTSNRTTGLASVLGYTTGVGFGAAAGWFSEEMSRMPAAAAALLAGFGATVAGQLPATLKGLTDPREWTLREWVEDIVPHLAYGAAYVLALGRLSSGRA